MKNVLTILLLITMMCKGYGQNVADYTPLKAQAPIPADILSSSSDKYETIKKDLADEKMKRSERKSSLDFYLTNNFVLDDLLASSKILFNDPLSIYVNKVKDELLKPLDNIKSEDIKIYVIKSPSVNAFASDRGEIFVNIGLLARLHDEAELAFILCHELQHYFEEHNLDTYIEFDKINSSKSTFRQNSSFDKILAKHSYSRDLEDVADELGLELFKKSNYSLKASERVMILLQMAHIPYAELPFDYSLLEVGGFSFTSDYKPGSIPSIEALDDEEDELSTHPSAKKRGERLKTLIGDTKEAGRKDFVISEREFNAIRKTARFEICQILLNNKSYGAAIYHAHLLHDEYPENVFLKKIIAQSLYGVGKYSLQSKYDEPDIDKIQGEMHAVYYLLSKLEDREIAALASRYAWDLYKRYEEEDFMRIIRNDMIEDIAMENSDFYDIYKEKEITEEATPEAQDNVSLEQTIFKDLLQDSTFRTIVERGFEYGRKREERKNAEEETQLFSKKWTKEDKRGLSLGIDTVIFVTPYFVKGKVTRRKSKIDLLGSEDSKIGIKGNIEKAGERLDMTTHVLDVDNMNDATTMVEYNDLQTINAWTNAFLSSDIYIYNPYTEEMLEIMGKYNTGKIAYFAGYTVRVPRRWSWFQLYRLALLYIPAAAPTSADLFFPRHESASAMLVLDFYDQRVVMKQTNASKVKLNKGNINSNLYWMMHQMKRSKK